MTAQPQTKRICDRANKERQRERQKGDKSVENRQFIFFIIFIMLFFIVSSGRDSNGPPYTLSLLLNSTPVDRVRQELL